MVSRSTLQPRPYSRAHVLAWTLICFVLGLCSVRATPEDVGVEASKEQPRVGEDGDAEEHSFIVYPPEQKRTPKSPSPFFFWFTKPITRPADAAAFWFDCMKKMERDADPNNLKRNRLDWPLTAVEKQFCRKLENRLMFEKDRRRSITDIVADENRRRLDGRTGAGEASNDEVEAMVSKNITRLHVYPRFGETLPAHSDFFHQYSSTSTPIIFEELGKRMVQDDTLLQSCLDAAGHTGNPSADFAPLSVSLPKKCPAFLKAIYQVPDFMSVDLYQSGNFRNEDGEYLNEHLSNGWPVVHANLQKEYVQPLKKATLGAHNLLVVLKGTVQIKLYDKKHHPYLLPRYNDSSDTGSEIYAADFTYDATPRFEKLSDAARADHSVPCYEDVLVEDESVYIPSGYIYTFKVLEDSGGKGMVLSHEFLDAASLNAHKEQTRLKLLKNGGGVDGESNGRSETHVHLAQYYSALRSMHTDKLSIEQTHGGSMMPWVVFKSFPRPERAQPKNRRERYKLWQAKKKWQQTLLHYTSPAPQSVTLTECYQESATVIIELNKKLPKAYADDVVVGFQISGFTHFEFSPVHTVSQNMKEEMQMRKDYIESPPASLLNAHRQIFHTRFAMKGDKEVFHDFGNNTFRLRINNLEPNRIYALRFSILTTHSMSETSDAVVVRTLAYSSPQQLEPPQPCKNNTHSVVAGLMVVNCIVVKIPKLDPNTLLPIEVLYVKWSRVDGQYPPMYDPLMIKVDLEQVNIPNDDHAYLKLDINNKVPGAQYRYQVAAFNSQGGLGKYSKPSPMIESARREKGSKEQPVTVLGRRHAFRETYDFYSKRGMRKGPSCMIRAEKQLLSMSVNYIEENDDHASFYEGMLNLEYPEHKIQLWRSHFSPVYDIFGELIIGDPVLGHTTFANRDKVRGRIVMVKRGVVPFVQKVRNAIEAGALGIIIVDDGRCPEDEDEWMHSQKCIVGSVFKNGDGWASQDNPEAWAQTRIPTYFVTTNVGGNLTSVVANWGKLQQSQQDQVYM